MKLLSRAKNHTQRIAGIKALREVYGLGLASADTLLRQAPVELPETPRESELRQKLTEAGFEMEPEWRPRERRHGKVPFSQLHPKHSGPFCGTMDCLTLCGESTFEVAHERLTLDAELPDTIDCERCRQEWELAQVTAGPSLPDDVLSDNA